MLCSHNLLASGSQHYTQIDIRRTLAQPERSKTDTQFTMTASDLEEGVCPSAFPRPRERQAAGRVSRYRASEGAVVAGPKTDGDAFCGRRSNRRGRRGSLVARLDAPQNVFGAEELAAGLVGE